ncbi:EAL domain-containing protein [Methylomonas sp. HW2-6]|uniref:bifunctional diguanylate cyclase/phosphodiesterase n=1 Tax=Methylomonas sp. HW2-6 TaxID=3376687 RepID=UPI0040418D58
MNRPRRYSSFTNSVLLSALSLALLVASIFLYLHLESRIDTAEQSGLALQRAADGLRQTVAESRRLALAYVIRGQLSDRQRHREIRDSRNAGGAVRSDSMREADFTAAELAKLTQAQTKADQLADIELAAVQLAENGVDDELERLKAAAMLESQAYRQTEAEFLQMLAEAGDMARSRTALLVKRNRDIAAALGLAVAAAGLMLALALWRVYRSVFGILGAEPEEVRTQIARLGRGDFAQQPPVPDDLSDSVMGWLSETQRQLAQVDAERREAEAKTQRLTQLYAALSQCNQAIVRCSSEAELFPQICRDAVMFGGMKMAWIGMLDPSGQCVLPVASYGSGGEYLADIAISIDPRQDSGCGPSGTALREDRAYWCQDYLNDPATSVWHELGARCGWLASAALPLHRNGTPVGTLNLYADSVNAFDFSARNLLLEMAMDIDHALTGFERDAERQHALQMETLRTFMLERLNSGGSLRELLDEVVRKLESAMPDCICSVLLLDESGRQVRVAAAPGLPDFYNRAIDGCEIGPGVGSCGNTAFTGQRTVVADIAQHPYWKNFKELAAQAGLGACWSEPILGSGKKVLGTFAIYQRYPASPDHFALRLLDMVAHFVALAIERKQTEEHIYHLANYDPLTGLPNRSQLNNHLKCALGLAQRANGQLALMFLDIDHFKDVNDTLGHSVGDALLVELALRLRAALRVEDIVTRLGGDEFIVLLPGANASSATVIAQKLLDAISEPFRIEHHDLIMSASIGVALYPDDGEDLETLSKSADTAMYRVKLEGRHGCRFFTPEMHANSARNLQLVTGLRHALERGELELHYQPQLSLKTDKITGAEALLRWRHPELGLVSPAEFIPVAEDSGLILPIGEWVIRTAVRQARQIMAEGLGPLVMAVNLSAVQFSQPTLPDLVGGILAEEGLPPEYLELELTEGVAMNHPQTAIAAMENLHRRGIRVAIDDFGTGYSSLSYLKKFKVYKLKIDQSFVRDITTDAEDKAIVSAVISLADSLGLATIAEGVETPEQKAFLRQQGCDEMQGYLFSRPLTVAQLMDFLR